MSSRMASSSPTVQKKKSMDSHGIPSKLGAGSKGGLTGADGSFHSYPKLQPEGVAQLPDSIYDSIVFYIYCTKHDKLALSRVERNDGCTWLPFVVMNERASWRKASQDGVMLLIGRQDSEMDNREAEKYTPKFDINCLHLLRIQTSSRKIVTRLTQFIRLVADHQFKCCVDNNFVEWHSSSDLLRNKIDLIWGPELKIFSSMLLAKKQNINCEFTLNDATEFLRGKHPKEQALLKQLNLTDIKIYDIFNDYLLHCYPSFYMCYESFVVYLRRYGFGQGNQKLYQKLFRATAYFHKWYIDFHEMLIALILMEPAKVNNENELRQRFIFTAYDHNDKGHLDKSEIDELISDCSGEIGKRDSEKSLGAVSSHSGSNKVKQKDFATFLKKISKAESLCRSPRSVLGQIIELQSKNIELHKHDAEPLRTEYGKNKGTCRACLPKQYEYGSHSVKIDTMGGCVEPIIVSDLWRKTEGVSERENAEKKKKENKMDNERYSLETVFAISSVPNVFLDLVSGFLTSDSSTKTIFNPQHEWKTFKTYMSILCADLKSILEAEQKLVRINSPCLVFSDLQGNIHDLGYLKKIFFTAFPIQPENLIFLGNYSGVWNNSVEVIIALFALKVLSANKVILLRGNFELSAQNSKTLLNECVDKYGIKCGKDLFNMLVNVFCSMPIAALVDDNIFCANTGIPKKDKIDNLAKMPKKIENVEHDQPLAYEILTRYPAGSQKNQMQKSCWFESSKRSNKKTSLSGINLNESKSGKSSKSSRAQTDSQAKMNSGGPSHFKSSGSQGCSSRPSSTLPSNSNISQNSPSKKTSHVHSVKSGSVSKISFHRKSGDNRKPIFLKNQKRTSMHSLLSKSESKLFKKRLTSYDRKEFHEFLCENNITHMIRGSSPADKGFKLQFDNRCISIFSVCNYKGRKNQGAAVLIEREAQRIRILRFLSSHHGSVSRVESDPDARATRSGSLLPKCMK